MDNITITKEEFMDKAVKSLFGFVDDKRIDPSKQAILMLLLTSFIAKLTTIMFNEDEENVVE